MKPIVQAQLYRDAADTLRYHTQRTLRSQTVGQHSFNMLMLIDLIAPDSRKEVLQAVLFHDLPEKFTGDMPAPIKRASPALKVLMDQLETDLAPLYREFDLTPEEHALVKWVDLMELAMFGLEELSMGNRYAEEVASNGLQWLQAVKAPNAKAQLLLGEMLVKGFALQVHGISAVRPASPSDYVI